MLDDEEEDEQSVEKEIVHKNPPESVAHQEPGPVYQLVQQPDDSDYESDYNSGDDDEDEIFDMIAKY